MLNISFDKFGRLERGNVVIPDNGITILTGRIENRKRNFLNFVYFLLKYIVTKEGEGIKDCLDAISPFENFCIVDNGISICSLKPGWDIETLIKEKPKFDKRCFRISLDGMSISKEKRILFWGNPENNLHPIDQRLVVKRLLKIVRKSPFTQVLLATNSPYIFDSLNVNTLNHSWLDKVKFYNFSSGKSVNDYSNNLDPIWDSFTKPLLKNH